MDITELLKERISKQCSIIFPEATEPDIVKAAFKAYDGGFCNPIFIGDKEAIGSLATSLGLPDNFYSVIPMDNESLLDEFAELYYETNQIFSIKKLKRLMKQPIYVGSIALTLGKADGMVCGLTYSTANVILASSSIIGLKENVSIPSSFFLMNIPNFEGPEKNLIILSDGGTCENPNTDELADIAITTAESAKKLLNWDPRVAMLSYSTNGSSISEMTEKVVSAMNIAKEKSPDLKIDGEMQLDAAIVPSVAAKKMGRESQVAGNANILIVPDLNVGNILYKAIQRFAKAEAYGPLLQGFNKPVNDLSRGSSVEDIFGVILVTCVFAQ